jgi:hypothetical protein
MRRRNRLILLLVIFLSLGAVAYKVAKPLDHEGRGDQEKSA